MVEGVVGRMMGLIMLENMTPTRSYAHQYIDALNQTLQQPYLKGALHEMTIMTLKSSKSCILPQGVLRQ